LGINCSQIF
jgi:hypothetical protein